MKIISKLLFTLLFIAFLIVSYLSLVGIETQKLNNQITSKIKSINENLDIKLSTIKIILDPFNFKINAKTIGPKFINENKTIEIENIKAQVSLKALLDDKFSLENLEISSKSLEINSLISFIRSINNKPELYFLEKIIKKGFLIADIKLEFDTDGKIKNNYKINGFIKDTKINVINKYKFDNVNFIFDLEKNKLFIDDVNFIFNDLSFDANKISAKDQDNSFLIQGEIDHKIFNLKNEKLNELLNPFIKSSHIQNLSFSSKNLVSLKLSKKFKIKDFKVISKVKLKELLILNNLELKNYFPNSKKHLSLSNNDIEIKYKEKKFSIIGNGKILLQDKDDKISYSFNKINKNLQFESLIQIKDNPVKIDLLNYESDKKNVVSINLKGNQKGDKQINIDLFELKEKNNHFRIKDLILNTDNKITKVRQANLDYLDKDGQKNLISLLKKNQKYVLKGTYLNADKLIDDILEDNENNSNILDINSKLYIDITKVRLDKDNFLTDLKGNFLIKNKKIIKGSMEGFFTEKKKLKLTLDSNGNDKITTLFLDHAEPIVRRYKFIKGFNEGLLDFYSSNNGNESKSTLKIYDFKLKELPVLTKILTLASLQGIADILSGEGIRFSEFEMNFTNKKNLMTIDEIYAIGPAISILMDGYIEKNKLISLRGTLVPATTINKFIGSLPLLGNILVGSKTGEGVFGVSFKIKGPPKNLETTVNPVKTLTPRFITRTLEKIKK